MFKPCTRPKALLFSYLSMLVLVVGVAPTTSRASVPLAPSAAVGLPGSTAAAEPNLAGTVLFDTLIPFDIKSAGGVLLCRGQLQNRVVRSASTPLVHFYYRIRGIGTLTAAPPPGRIRRVVTAVFSGYDPLRVDWRADGLGVRWPNRALRNGAPGAQIAFDFQEPTLPCATESRFFFVKTNAVAFGMGGRTRIILATGESSPWLPTAQPVQ